MGDNDPVSVWLDDLKNGDDEALQKLWHRYFESLAKLGGRRLSGPARRISDGEDVALSALNSFFQRAQQGKYPQLEDREDLWKLLVTITKCKAIDYNEHAGRRKRGAGKVRGESSLEHADSSSLTPGIERVVSEDPTPDFLAMLSEQYRFLLNQIGDEKAREVAELRLQGYTTQEIAEHLQVSPRTVERKSKLVRSTWRQELTREE